ncbi:NAD(P)-dependent oxidoreductase [Aldersonia sp. NBC_00410]|uniref:NAD(P)-dependent oxidoreductase n=1 Tax=Aldersonia sp. NBC_00410 TaxID=2975954 RepID=UPI00224C9709|nr:NAD(P)-dependent oxidoreductase [Aldersonia sp. NBC_00410]MCX5045357.1 NAD(P)-dependent oxidoreductase [Aldersonia sp. NBC_00410]
MSEVIGFVGAGQMGEPMVGRLIDGGHRVVLFARRPEVRERLQQRGAELADSVADLASRADIVIVCTFSDTQLVEVVGGADGLMANAKPGAVVVSHATGTVATLEKLAAEFPGGPTLLDAPVSGSADEIKAGELTVLFGGDDAAVARVEPVLAAYAQPIIRTGGLGTALNLKLVNNILFAANAQLVAAAVELGERLGVRDAQFLEALSVCSARSYAASSIHLIGGPTPFVDVAGPFLRKDVAACVAAAANTGTDLGWLHTVVESGPLSLS